MELGQAAGLGDSGLGALTPQGEAGDCLGSLRVVEFWGRDGREARVMVERSDWNCCPLRFLIHSITGT